MMTTDFPITLCAVRAADGGARLVLILQHCAEGEKREERLCVFAKRLTHVPQPGPLCPETYTYLLHEAAIFEAVALGLRLLGYSGLSRHRLTQKLRARGVAFDLANEAAELLAADGYLDECESARACARADMAKLWGDKRILADLAAKGFGGEALCTVKEMLCEENGIERCVKLIKKRHMDLPQDDADAARFAATLTRYGYSVREMKAAFEILRDEFEN